MARSSAETESSIHRRTGVQTLVSRTLLSPILVSLTSTLRPSVSPTLSPPTAMASRAVVMQTQCWRP